MIFDYSFAENAYKHFSFENNLIGLIVTNDTKDIILKNKKAKILLSDEDVKLIVTNNSFNDYNLLINQSKELVIIIEKSDPFYILLVYKLSEFEQYARESASYKDLKKEYQVVLDYIDDGIVVLDGQGLYLRVNKAIRGEVDEKHYIGKKASDLVKMGFMSTSLILEVVKYGNKKSMLLKVEDCPDLLVTEIPYYENGDLKLIIACERNMTDLKLLEKQIIKKNSKTEVYNYESRMLSVYGNDVGLPIVAESKITKKILELIQRVAKTNSTLLFQGESGVGKEIFVKFAYLSSMRNNKPFIKINCGAIPVSLLESELFGYVPGAFTGANKNGKAGYFEAANGGTLFLDEISEIPLELQVKLLRVIQEREVTRIGSTNPIHLDVRLMIATNKDLKKEVENGRFRLDLYYRLSVIMIEIPPLKKRRDDIRGLIAYFLDYFNEKSNLRKCISESAITILETYDWPGNVRELENLIERLVAVTVCDIIDDYDVWECLKEEKVNLCTENEDKMHNISMPDYEKLLLENLMKKHNNNTVKVAEEMNLSRSTINRKLKKFRIR